MASKSLTHMRTRRGRLWWAGLLVAAIGRVGAQEEGIAAAAYAAWERDASAAAPTPPGVLPPATDGRRKPRRVRHLAAKPWSPRRVSHVADLMNGAMLLLSAPLALRNGIASVAAARNLLLGGWLSSFGAAILLVESRIPFIHRWLRRDMRLLTTDAGRLALLLCAATMSLASGPSGAVPALITLANAYYGAHVRRTTPRPRRSRPPGPRQIAEGSGGSRGGEADEAEQAERARRPLAGHTRPTADRDLNHGASPHETERAL